MDSKCSKEIVYSELTKELLFRIKKIKEGIQSSMMIGERFSLLGVSICESVIMELNPNEMNLDVYNLIDMTIQKYMKEKEKDYIGISSFVNYGINCCMTMIYCYNNTLVRGKKGR